MYVCSHLRALLLQRFEGNADLFEPLTTLLLHLVSQQIVAHVHVGVFTRPLHVLNVQTHLALDVLHRLFDARRELLRAANAHECEDGHHDFTTDSPSRCPQIRPCDTASDGLRPKHWLRVPQCIQYKLCVLVYGCLNGIASGYLSDLTVSVGSTARRQLRSASTSDLVVPPTRRASTGDRTFAERGTVNRLPSVQPPNRSLPSKKNLNRFFLVSHFGRDNVNFDYIKRSSNSLYHIIALNKLS